MHWTELKKRVYFEDGSLRDILVLGATVKDWEIWIDLVNEKYQVEFWDAKTVRSDKIDFAIVKELWDSDGEREVVSATIKLGPVNVKCYFFYGSDIENDILPCEVKLPEDHERVVAYLKDMSISLGKEVILTDEGTATSVLIRVKDGDCIYA